MNKNASLTAIAKKANVSTGTVSRVFSNSNLVKEKTREKVLKIARSMGCRPKTSTSSKKLHIALITEPPSKTVMGGYVSTLTQNICFSLSLANAEISLITEDNLNNINDMWFDGVIAIAWFPETIERLKKINNMPVVWINRNDLCADFNIVRTDHYQTGKLVGDYLTGKGHKKIAVYMNADQQQESANMERNRGITQAVEEAGLDTDNDLLFNTNGLSLQLFISKLLSEQYTSLWLVSEDMVSIEALWLIQDLVGKKIPDQISVIGMENPGISAFLRPALTTIAQPLAEMAQAAVDIITDDAMRGKSSECVNRIFPIKLIERQSVSTIRP